MADGGGGGSRRVVRKNRSDNIEVINRWKAIGLIENRSLRRDWNCLLLVDMTQ